ncbi:PAS domain-containing sensor histidine kinase [Patescibacteria group bacterium]|nr:PAS domain-containing sensor histidine kinase [Patescibacteria group bacterium]
MDQSSDKNLDPILRQNERLEKQRTAILNVLEDIAEEKEKFEKLEKKFEDIARSSSDFLWEIDDDGKYTYASGRVKEILGYETDEIIGKTPFDLMEEEEVKKVRKDFDKAVSAKKPILNLKNWNLAKDGRKVCLLTNGVPMLDKRGNLLGYRGADKDITMQEDIDKAKTEFVSLASHQLRTPLTAISWYTEMVLAGDAGKITPEQKKYLEEVYSGNKRMIGLVNALLNVSRLELGTFMVEPEETTLKALAELIIKELDHVIKKKKMKFVFDYDETIPKMMLDVKLITMVFQNLMSNAVKYTPEGGKVSLIVKKEGDKAKITIADSGYGIPKHQQNRIFSKLFRADNVTQRDTEGTGLGLYLVKEIVETAGGKVWFESEEDKGTSFFVELPLAGMSKRKGTKQLT